MLNVCPNCHYLGKDKYDYSPNNFLYGSITTILGLLFLLGTYILDKHLIYKLVALFLLFGGIILIREYFKGRVCPNCSYKEMLPIDNPEAINIIKQNDLQPGMNNPAKRNEP